MFRTFETTLAGRPLVIETGKMAQLANGHCLVRYGDTVVMVNVTASRSPREGVDFFPLSVDYEEKLYSVGKIPGGYIKREGKPSEKAILTSRVIDRPIRPLFPSDLRNDVSVVATVLSVEQDNPPEVAAMIGTSIAISISDVPWNGPIGGVWLGLVDGEYVINPTVEQREKSEMLVTVAGTKQKVVMIEAGANEVEESVMLEGIKFAHKHIIELCDFISGIQAEIGKEKFTYESHDVDHDLYDAIKNMAFEKLQYALDTDDKNVRDERIGEITDEIIPALEEQFPDINEQIGEILYKMQKEIVRAWLVQGRRVDGRGLDEIRPLAAEVDLLPRTHGSGMFTRGQTQVLSVATLAPLSEIQKLDGIDLEETKRYIHHYNFPPYSVGETKPLRSPGRREIGHGALAEKALVPVLPSREEFPYAIRQVSEAIGSNGSTSMGSVCASTLSLLAAGVPLKAPVAGIAMGLVSGDVDGKHIFKTLTDILGAEDAFGDMDFKVAGTSEFITALQLDTKLDGIPADILAAALQQAKEARATILEVINECIDGPAEMSEFAPRIITTSVPVEKIGEVIGPKGKMINQIQEDTGAEIAIEDDGTVFISSEGGEAAEKAKAIIDQIANPHVPEAGETYNGKVVKTTSFGAFVNLTPGTDGLLHISQIRNLANGERIDAVEDVLKEGDTVEVIVQGVDDRGKISLAIPGFEDQENNARPSRGDRDDRRGGRGRGDRDDRRP